MAEVRAGATLLFDSVPESEEKETELKASACLGAVRNPHDLPQDVGQPGMALKQADNRVVLIDFEDSFVHTLANYLRQTGATVSTIRHTQAEQALAALKPDLVVLSPGPGRPTDFGVSKHIDRLLKNGMQDFWSLPWPAEYCGALWWQAGTAALTDAWETFRGEGGRASGSNF